jgi:hypothetical protein
MIPFRAQRVIGTAKFLRGEREFAERGSIGKGNCIPLCTGEPLDCTRTRSKKNHSTIFSRDPHSFPLEPQGVISGVYSAKMTR